MSSSSSAKRAAVVCGGAMGIGGEVCARLAGAGHTVVVANVNLDAAETTARRLREAGGRAAALRLDVGQPASVAFEQAVAREHGRCDILVISAGMAKVFVSGGGAPRCGIDSAAVPGGVLPCAS